MQINKSMTERITCICFLTIMLLSLGVTDSRANGMTPELTIMQQSVREVAISPDGKLTAYTLSVPRNPFDEDNGSSWSHLYLADENGKTRPFITGKVRISKLGWMPDGSAITYLSERGEDTTRSLYTIAVDGGESQKLFEFYESISSYALSPDGKYISFLSRDSIPAAIKKIEKKGFKPEVYEENLRFTRVFIKELGSEKPARRLDLKGSASNLTWSPSGNLLAIHLAPTSLVDHSYMYNKVTLVDPNDGRIVRQYNTPGKLGMMAWNIDGTSLGFITAADINDPSAGELVVGSIDSDELQPLITNFDGHVRRIAWTSTNQLIYLADQGVHTVLGYISTDGKKTKTIIPPGDVAFTSLSLSKDGRNAALRGSSPLHPNELFILNLKDAKPKRITNSNPEYDKLELGRTEIVSFKARDGLELQGILIHPVGEEKGKRYPLILSVHGGPESNHRNSWMNWYSSPAHVFASRGFAVFYTNYRGSTGRGVEFSKMGQADYAGGEFNDLVDAVDHLVAIGLVDKDKVGITGGSYGGYASAWGATALTEHFAASVMRVGVSDLISKFGTTDIPEEMFHVHARRWPWDHWQFYLERSPIYYAQQANTPILIIHGKNDTRVHPSQSMELYRYLKQVGKAPVRLVMYPGEGHGTSKTSYRYDTCLRVLRWMEHYLKGEGGEPPSYDIDYSGLKTSSEG